MATRRKHTKTKGERHRRSTEERGRVRHLQPPKIRHQKSLALVAEAARSATSAALSVPHASDERPAILFDVSFLQRGINALAAVGLLCGSGHWEFAASAVRQVFELVLNVEYIAAQADRPAAMLRYQKFGLLQMARQVEASLEYDRKTGRTVDEDRLAHVRSLLDRAFDEFRDYRKSGSWRWAQSWSGKSVRELAYESAEPIRRDQYGLLFSAWSDQTHASPGVLLGTMVSGDSEAEEIMAADDVRIAETLASAVTMFLDLWARLPTIPGPEPAQVTRWYGHFLDEAKRYGGVVTAGKAPATE